MKQPYSRASKVALVIKSVMVDRSVANQKMLSEYSGIKEATLSKKMTGESPWMFDDFKKLNKPLHFNADDWIKIGKAFGLELKEREARL